MPTTLLTGAQLGSRTAIPPRPAQADCACPPQCPVCGGLECLCRPRFFPGQVLRDDDLTRLENYVVAKNRLHNRYFHGTGVVCGLEVVCDLCTPDAVTVRTGYALSPCGDDIVVCRDASVNICDLINRCKPRGDNCDPYGFQTPRDCNEGLQRWVLSICYDEKPSRGVQPLMSEPCACSCGGGASCGCGASSGSAGCGYSSGSKPPLPKTNPASSRYNPQCEPTLTCEGFSFTATKYVPAAAADPTTGANGIVQANASRFGPLLTRLMACFVAASQIRATFGDRQIGDARQLELATHYGEYADALRAFAEAHVSHRCDIARRLACIDRLAYSTASLFGQLAAAAAQGYSAADWSARYEALDNLLIEAVRDCFCSALLPPCPSVPPGNCVPLAVVTINADTCEIIEICNWTARKFALTLPTLAYWTSFINWGALQQAVAKLCCGEIDVRQLEALFAILSRSIAAGTTATTDAGAGFATAAAASAAPVDAAISTYTALLGLIEQAARPDGMARMLNPVAAPAASDLADLKASVAALQKTIAAQQDEIDRLTQKR